MELSLLSILLSIAYIHYILYIRALILSYTLLLILVSEKQFLFTFYTATLRLLCALPYSAQC